MKKEDLRKAVILPSMKGYFHQWGTRISLDGGKAHAVTMAIFEDQTGKVHWADPDQVFFQDWI